MDPATHLSHLRAHGRLLAEVAAAGTGDEPVPGCPGWTLDDLVRHVGAVHLWARSAVEGEGAPPPTSYDELAKAAPRDHAALPDWYAETNADLCAALEQRDAGTPTWNLLSNPAGADFWKRRQAHETLIHCHDAHLAIGRDLDMDRDLAVDGIGEVLLFFVERAGRQLVSETPLTLAVHVTDADRSWAIRIGPDSRSLLGPDEASADARVAGTAADVDLFLWNRRDAEGLEAEGDSAVLGLWRAHARIR